MEEGWMARCLRNCHRITAWCSAVVLAALLFSDVLTRQAVDLWISSSPAGMERSPVEESENLAEQELMATPHLVRVRSAARTTATPSGLVRQPLHNTLSSGCPSPSCLTLRGAIPCRGFPLRC